MFRTYSRAEWWSKRIIFTMAMVLAILPAVVGSVAAWMKWQPENLPVVDRFIADDIVIHDNGDVELSGSFYKIYPDYICEFKRLRFFALRGGQKLRLGRPAPSDQEVYTQFEDRRPRETENNRDEGYNPYYGWRLGTSEWPRATAVQGRVYHTCFGFVPFVTDMPVVRFK